jgi:hypothetical protein
LHAFGGKMTTFEPKSTILDSMDLIAIKNPDVLLAWHYTTSTSCLFYSLHHIVTQSVVEAKVKALL